MSLMTQVVVKMSQLQIDLYTDTLERLTVEQNDSGDSDIVQPRRRRIVCIDSESDNSSTEENTWQHDNVWSSEEWKDVTESDVPPATINFDLHEEIAGPQVPSNIKEPIDTPQVCQDTR